MPSSSQRLLTVAPWLGRADARQPQPANTNNRKDKGPAKPRHPKGVRVVTDRQYQDAQSLNSRFGYVISVDDALVLADDERSPLVIGFDQVIPANDNVKVKGKRAA